MMGALRTIWMAVEGNRGLAWGCGGMWACWY
jgi:hypothetical protein